MTDGFADIFPSRSDRELARLEPAFSIRLRFERVQAVGTMPSGAARGAVYVDDGVISGPMLNGRVVPNSGGDYALFRPDGVISFDAVYMLEADDGTPILMRNRGYLWGRKPGVMDRIRSWVLEGGAPVDFDDYYLRSFPTFECAEGTHDWLMRHVIVGVGERMKDGNLIRYYVLT
jgi:hypothetical protein